MKLRGKLSRKVDEKSSQDTAVFLDALKEYGNQFYITVQRANRRIYPMKVWSEIEDKLAKGVFAEPACRRQVLMRAAIQTCRGAAVCEDTFRACLRFPTHFHRINPRRSPVGLVM